MSQTTNRLSLPLIQGAQAQKHIPHNEALAVLDALVQPVTIDADRTIPPTNPSEGDVHIVATGATDDWAGQDGSLAVLSNGGWMFVTPRAGWRIRDLATSDDLSFDGTTWAAQSGGDTSLVGVNATADTNNRLTVSSPGTLLTHEGGGHRLTLNKASAGDTGSLLFQTGFGGRAEMGTAGTDDFAVKVSADGASWNTAMVVDAATAIPSYPQTPSFSATATGSWRDVTQPDEDLPFDAVTFDQGGHFDTATGSFTAPVAGVYAFLLNGFIANTTDGRICFAVDGVSRSDQTLMLSGAQALSFNAIFSLSAGQSVTCRTGDVNVLLRYMQSRTSFSGWKVS